MLLNNAVTAMVNVIYCLGSTRLYAELLTASLNKEQINTINK